MTLQEAMRGSMAWLWLVIAGLLEAGWAIGIKYSEGFTKPGASVVTLVLMGISFWLLSRAVKTLPIGTAYAVWVGIGALGAAILGVLLFQEKLTPQRIGFLALLLIAIIGLKLTGSEEDEKQRPEGVSGRASDGTERPGVDR